MAIDLNTIKEGLGKLGGTLRTVGGDLGGELRHAGPRIRTTSDRAVRSVRGFTLAEMLTVVGLVLIMTSIGFVGVIQMRDSLRFMQMNDTAREIYIVAQDQMSRGVERAGLQDKLDRAVTAAGKGNSDYLGTHIDASADEDALFPAPGEYYYISHSVSGPVPTGTILDDILPLNSIAEDVREGQYTIVYNASTATVFEVFYTDGQAGNLPAWSVLNGGSPNLRDEDTRRSYRDCTLGYYGGTTVNMQGISLTDLSVTVDNGNRLRATINYPDVVDLDGQTAVLSLVVVGRTSGAQRTIPVATVSGSSLRTINVHDRLPVAFQGATLDDITATSTTVLRASVVLDDVTHANSGNAHFASLFGTASDNDDPSKSFIPGEDIDVSATMTIENSPAGGSTSNHVVVNSLFAAREEATTGEGATATSANTIDIANFRHLENLDKGVSGFDPGTSTTALVAQQTRDFTWEALAQGNTNTFSSYGVDASQAKFEDIFVNDLTNGIITLSNGNYAMGSAVRAYYGVKVESSPASFTYEGGGNAIINAYMSAPAGESVGLFRQTNAAEVTFDNVHLSTPTLVAQGGNGYAGALVGEVLASKSLTVTSCEVSTVKANDETLVRGSGTLHYGTISGDTLAAGGLIGRTAVASGSITDTYVALRKITTTSVAGGFIGEVNGSAGTLGITGCYASGRTSGGKYDEKNEYNLGFNVETTATGGATGGFVGRLSLRQGSGNGLQIRYSYSTASVKGADAASAGGFVGQVNNGAVLIDYCYSTGLVYATSSDDADAMTAANLNRHPFVGSVVEPSAVEVNKDHNWYLGFINTSVAPETRYAVEQSIDKTGSTEAPGSYDTALADKLPYLSCRELTSLGGGTVTTLTPNSHVGDWPELPEADDTLMIVNANQLIAVLLADKPQQAVIRLYDPNNTSNYIEKTIAADDSGWVPVTNPDSAKHAYYYEWLLDDPTTTIKCPEVGNPSNRQPISAAFGSQFFNDQYVPDNVKKSGTLVPGNAYMAAAVLGSNTYDTSRASTPTQFSTLFADNNTVASVADCQSITLDNSTAYIAYGRHLLNLNKVVSNIGSSPTAAVQIRSITWARDGLDSEVIGEKVNTDDAIVAVRSGSSYDVITGLHAVWDKAQTTTSGTTYRYNDIYNGWMNRDKANFYSIQDSSITSYTSLSGYKGDDGWTIYNFKSNALGPSIFQSVNHALSVTYLTVDGVKIDGGWNDNTSPSAVIAGSVGGALTINHVVVKDATVYGQLAAGGISGTANSATITNSSFEGTVTSNHGMAGGLLAQSGGAFKAQNCTFTDPGEGETSIKGNSNTGGIVGRVAGRAEFDNADFDGNDIKSDTGSTGGLAGYVTGDLVVKDCEVEAATILSSNGGTGYFFTGGLAGGVDGGATINSSSVDVAAITSTNSSAGGLIGELAGGRANVGATSDVTVEVSGAISASGHAGGAIGLAKQGATLSKLTITAASITSSANNVGGAIGEIWNNAGLTSNGTTVTVSGAISGNTMAGGIVGKVEGTANLQNDVVTAASITSTGNSAAGIASEIENAAATITSPTVNVPTIKGNTGNGGAGGIVGWAKAGVTIKGAKYTGTTVSGNHVGGIVGVVSGGLLTIGDTADASKNCTVSVSTISGNARAGGYVGTANAGATITGANITSVTITSSGDYAGGVIGSASGGALTLSNSTVTTSSVSTTSIVGGIAGRSEGAATLTSVVNDRTSVSTSGNKAGGLIGEARAELTVRTSHATISTGTPMAIKGKHVGGIVGYANASAEFTDVYNFGFSAISDGDTAGGIAGTINGSSTWTRVYVTSNSTDSQVVRGGSDAGGLAGSVGAGTKGLTVTDCFATAFVYSGGNSGGLFGYAGMVDEDTIQKAYVGGHTTQGKYKDGLYSIDANGNITYSRGASSMPECFNIIGADNNKASGGFIGQIALASGTASISNCYSTASVYSGWGKAGGFIGMVNGNGTISCNPCYATGLVANEAWNQTYDVTISSFMYSGNITGDNRYYITGMNALISPSSATNFAHATGVDLTDSRIAGNGSCAYPFDSTLIPSDGSDATHPFKAVTNVGPNNATVGADTTTPNCHYGDWPTALPESGSGGQGGQGGEGGQGGQGGQGGEQGSGDSVGTSWTYTQANGSLDVIVTCTGTDSYWKTNAYQVTINNNSDEAISNWTIYIPFQNAFELHYGPSNVKTAIDGNTLQITSQYDWQTIQPHGSYSNQISFTAGRIAFPALVDPSTISGE